MAQVTYASPGLHYDPTVELTALRAKCNRLQTERDRFKEALWALRGNFSALQTHAEGLELENGELRDMLSMSGVIWGAASPLATDGHTQEEPRSPSAPISDGTHSLSATNSNLSERNRPERPEVSTLPKPLMRVQEFIEGSSNPAPAMSPSPTLTAGSIGPPPSSVASLPLRFQASQLPELARSHSPNLPRSRTLAPVGPPSQYKKSNGKRKSNAASGSANAGFSTARELRSATKRSLGEISLPSDESYMSPKKPRTASISSPIGIRSMISLPEDTDPTVRARFDSMLTPRPSLPSTSQASTSSTSAEDCPSDARTIMAQEPTDATVQQSQLPFKPRTPSPSQQPSPPPTQHPTPQHHLRETSGDQPPPAPGPCPIPTEAREVRHGTQGPLPEPTLVSYTSEGAAAAPVPQHAESKDGQAEAETSPAHTPSSESIHENEAQRAAAVQDPTSTPRNPVSRRASAASSPASSASARVTRSSRDRSEDLHGKHRRAKTHWDPVTGQRIQVGPPRGAKPTNTAARNDGETRKLVISISPRKARDGK